MALGPNAMTTVATVLDEVGAAANATHTARAERFIEAASDFVVSHCRRPFARAVVTENVQAVGAPHLFLRRTPILSVTSVVNDDNEVDATLYRIETIGGVAQALFKKTGWRDTAAFGTPISRDPIADTQGASVVVVYEGGHVTPQHVLDSAFSGAPRTLPFDLEDAVVRLVASRWRAKGKDVRERSKGYEASAVSFGAEPVPPEVLATLRRYTRIAHG